MIDQKDYKNIIKDLGNRLKVPVLSNINDIKKNGLYIVLKFIKRDSIIRDSYNNYMVTEWDLIVTGKGANVPILLDILNLEFRMIPLLQREIEFSISKGIVVGSLKYAIIDNEDEPEENEIEKENISYKKVYKLQILFKR